MSAPTLPDDNAVGAPERLHPFFLLTGLGRSLKGIGGGYAVVGYLAVSGRLRTALFGAIGLLVVLAVSVFLYWRRFEYRVGESEIRIDSGIISRNHRSIPFDRIQDVDISQGPLARLLGVASVKLETGGGAKDEEGVLHAIAMQRAQELRELVRARRTGSAAATTPKTDSGEDSPPIYAMNAGRLVLAGLFNFSLALFAGLIGITQTFGDLLGFDPLNRSFWLGLVAASGPLRDFLLAHRIAAAVAGLVLLVLIGFATGIVRTVLRDYGFRLDRTGVGLRRRRGLLTRTDVTLPVNRVQAALVGTGPLRDAFGWRDLKLQSLARDEAGKADHIVAPLARDPEVDAIVAELGWPSLDSAADWRRVSRAYVATLAIGLAPVLLIALAQAAVAPLLGLSMVGVLLLVLGTRWVAWRRTAYALDGDRLLIRTGWWRRRLLVLPLARIQSVDLTQSFVDRWFGIASLMFGVAGGGGFAAHLIPALPRNIAYELRERLLGAVA